MTAGAMLDDVWSGWRLFKQLHPPGKSLRSLLPESLQALQRLFGRSLAFEVRLGVELVGITNHLFLHSLGQKVLMRQGQVLVNDVLQGDSGTRMAFANPRVSGETSSAQHVCSDDAMLDIRFGAKALDARCIAFYNADVVQHGRFLDEGTVEFQLWMLVDNLQCLAGYAFAVRQEDVPNLASLRVILIDDG